MALVEVNSLSKRYEKILAVDNINFELEEGEVFGFLGPNGAGKTTTVRMMTGVVAPTEGKVTIGGFDIQKHPLQAKMLINVTPESANAYVDLSAWQNIQLIGELYCIKKEIIKKRARELLEKFELYNKKDIPIKKFSKGMKQRVLISMSLINEPKILFLDEPTSGLDVKGTKLVKKTISNLAGEGKTIFLTTHNIEEANQLCTRIGIINKGKLIAIDKPSKLKKKTKSLQSVEVVFEENLEVGDLSSYFKNVRVMRIGDRIKFYTNSPGKLATQIISFAKENGLSVLEINTFPPSLEDIFLELTEERL
ncbi:MAG: ATP-binding cassette domain-containing protein [Candidatus Methanofastidiosia archaeon]